MYFGRLPLLAHLQPEHDGSEGLLAKFNIEKICPSLQMCPTHIILPLVCFDEQRPPSLLQSASLQSWRGLSTMWQSESYNIFVGCFFLGVRAYFFCLHLQWVHDGSSLKLLSKRTAENFPFFSNMWVKQV
jgi:hypothetical protein